MLLIDKLKLGALVSGFIFMILVAIGWVMNIIALIHLESIDHLGEVIIRFIGIFIAPIGAVMGWFF